MAREERRRILIEWDNSSQAQEGLNMQIFKANEKIASINVELRASICRIPIVRPSEYLVSARPQMRTEVSGLGILPRQDPVKRREQSLWQHASP
jgi:hypothetical protein